MPVGQSENVSGVVFLADCKGERKKNSPDRRLGHPPFFFFRLLSNAFSDFGSVGRKRKKNKKQKYN